MNNTTIYDVLGKIATIISENEMDILAEYIERCSHNPPKGYELIPLADVRRIEKMSSLLSNFETEEDVELAAELLNVVKINQQKKEIDDDSE